MTVLDVGCGVGKPAREISTFTGCNVVGLNNNAYQVERATAHAAREGLSDKVSFTKGNFMVRLLIPINRIKPVKHCPTDEGGPKLTATQEINFPPNSFSAAYAIEATVHAPSLEAVYAQVFRVLKPGAVFGLYEWVMTDAYDESNKRHREIRLGIERGNGISNMVSKREALAAMQQAGFVVEFEEDLAERSAKDKKAWWAPLAGDLSGATNLWDFLGYVRISNVGRLGIGALLRTMEALRLAPSGTAETARELSDGGDALVAGGREGLFTPMYLMIGRKPVV